MYDTDVYTFLELCELSELSGQELKKKGYTKSSVNKKLDELSDNIFQKKAGLTISKAFSRQIQRQTKRVDNHGAAELFNAIDKMSSTNGYIVCIQALNQYISKIARNKNSYMNKGKINSELAKEMSTVFIRNLEYFFTHEVSMKHFNFYKQMSKNNNTLYRSEPNYSSLQFIDGTINVGEVLAHQDDVGVLEFVSDVDTDTVIRETTNFINRMRHVNIGYDLEYRPMGRTSTATTNTLTRNSSI